MKLSFVCLFLAAEMWGATLSTTTGLRMDLDGTGQLTGLKLSGADLTVTAGPVFSVADFAVSTNTYQAVSGTISGIAQGLQFAGTNQFVGILATLTSNSTLISIQGTITNLTNYDRAIALRFRLPFDADSWRWYDDTESNRAMTSAIVYKNTTTIVEAGPGEHSIYPLACVASSTNALGLSLAIPMTNAPLDFVLAYDNANKELDYTAYIGLTTNALKIYNSGSFSLVLYPSASAYGFRAGLQTFYETYPSAFKRRNTYEAYYGYSTSEVPLYTNHNVLLIRTLFLNDMSDFGEGYTNVTGMNASKYDFFMSDPGGTNGPLTPSDANVIAALQTNTEFASIYPGSNAVLQLVRSSTNTLRYLGSSYSSNAPTGWNLSLRVNQDPDITGALTNVLNTRLNSFPGPNNFSAFISSDGSEGWSSTRAIDYSVAHLNVTDYTPTFGGISLTPAIFNNIWEFYSTFLFPKTDSGKFLFIGNAGAFDQLYSEPFTDIGFSEGSRVISEYRFYRAISQHKTWRIWSTLPPLTPYTDAQFLTALRTCLEFGFYPPLDTTFYGSKTEPFRQYYRLYMPAIEELSAAGWEPISYATNANASAVVERFGQFTNNTMRLSVANSSTNTVTTTIYMDGAGLGAASGLTWAAQDLISRDRIGVDSNAFTFSLTLTNGETKSFWINNSTGAFQRATSMAVSGLQRIQRMFTNELVSADNTRISNLISQLNGIASNGDLLTNHQTIFTNLDSVVSHIITTSPIDLNKLVCRIRSDVSFGVDVAAGIELTTPRQTALPTIQLAVRNDLSGNVGTMTAQIVSGWQWPNVGGAVTNIPDTLTQGMQGTYAVTLNLPSGFVRTILPYLVRVDGIARGSPFTSFRLLDQSGQFPPPPRALNVVRASTLHAGSLTQ